MVLAAHPYAPILVLILVVMGIVALIMVLTHVIGPRRHGRVKDETYEAGMAPVGDARRRFNVRFYLVAMIFLLFDVEVIFLWPWAPIFYDAAVNGRDVVTAAGSFGKTFLLVQMAIFTGLLLIGYLYDLRKGLFRWA
jgi:NADH-quinone oxidoreductase subunit A